MSGLLGLAAALSYGLGDFLGGALSRRVPTLTLVTLGQGAALLVLLPVSLLSSSTISAAALGWGAAAGLAGAAGSYCFLRGFAAGRLAVVTPAAAVTASGLPVLADLARGIVPATLTALGVALALIAVALVGARDPARPDSAARSPSAASPTGGTGLAWGLGAGTAHAAMYVLLGLAPPDAGPWPATALVLAAAGLGAVLTASAVAFALIKWAGVAYLAVLGVSTLWRTWRDPDTAPATTDTPEPEVPATTRRWWLVRQEFLVAITNPKALLLFVAFLPQFVPVGTASAPALLVLGAAYIAVEAVSAVGYTLLGGRIGAAELSRRLQRRLDVVTGVSFVGLAGALATENRP